MKNDVKEMVPQLEFLGETDLGDLKHLSPGAFQNVVHERRIFLNATRTDALPHLLINEPWVFKVKPNFDYIERSGLEEFASDVDLFVQISAKLLCAAYAKAPYAAGTALKKLEEDPDNKVIVFSERVAVARAIFEALEERKPGLALVHHGGMKDAERKDIVNQFRSSENDARILVSTRQSLAEGVNLQCANIVVFNDIPWTPADIRQAAGRVKRLNQTKAVEELWLTTDLAFDENLLKILKRKHRLFRTFKEGKNITAADELWMNRRVSLYEIAGIAKPSKQQKASKNVEESKSDKVAA